MIDQTRVQSGYDVEVLLGSRYLQHLLLLAADVGVLPASVTVHGTVVQLMQPRHADRTYDQNPDAEQLVDSNVDSALDVEVLVGDPSGADLRVTLHVVASGIPEIELHLYFKLSLDVQPAPDGGLGRVTVGTELVDVDGFLVDYLEGLTPPIAKDQVIAELAPHVNRSLDLGSTGSGGRLESLALRKHVADADHDAALGLLLNLRLRSGPQPDRFVAARGDVGAAVNFLAAGTDVAFATRPGLYAELGPDARFRRAEPDGSDYDYPIHRHPSDSASEVLGQLLDVTVRPPQIDDATAPQSLPDGTRIPGGAQPVPPPAPGGYLTLKIHGDYSIDWFPDPDYRLYVYLSQGTDPDGVLTWTSDSEFEAGILADVLLGVLSAVASLVLGPGGALIAFTGLELFKELVAEPFIVDPAFDERVDPVVDAALLDVAPNRFTILRRRWDPFFETHHQVGLRPGEVDVDDLGIAMAGPVVLTRQPAVVRGSVIRDAVRDVDGGLIGLAYRVAHLDDYLALKELTAPGTDRGPLAPLPAGLDVDLLAVTVDDAVARAGVERLERDVPYQVVRVEIGVNDVTGLLLLSLREYAGLRSGLLGARGDAARAQVTADQGAAIRDQVLADLAAQGILATVAQVDAETGARIEALVAAEVAAYEAGQLVADLGAAVDAAATLVLTPDEAGRLQDAGVLRLPDYDLVHIDDPERRYYRDRYVRTLETTDALRLADNLRSKPRFHRTPDGSVLI